MRAHALLTATALLGTAAIAGAWPFILDGTADDEDRALAVAIAPGGDPIAAGFLTNTGGRDFVTLRVGVADTAELWRSAFFGGPLGLAYDVAVDASGDALVAGTTQTAASFIDFTVAKIDGATGAPLWRTDLNGPAANGLSYDQGLAVAVDGSGDVAAVGFVQSNVPGFASDWLTVKLSGVDGSELWRAVATGDGDGAGGGDYPYAMTMDTTGNVVSGGVFRNQAAAVVVFDFGVVKYAAADGSLVWRRDIRGTGVAGSQNAVAALATTATDDVVAAGRLSVPQPVGAEFFVTRLAGATGATMWSRTLGETGSAKAVRVDGAGDVVAAGTPGGFAVVKLSGADGTVLWAHRTGRPGDTATAVAITPGGDVLAAGDVDNDFTVIKLSGTDGTVLWNYAINSVGTAYGLVYGLVVDAAGNPTAVGYLEEGWGSSDDFTIVRLDGITGAPAGCGNGVLDPGEQCDDGNVASGDGCDVTCTPSACGNKVAAGGEECDDGNTAGADGCSATCQIEVCGNGVLDDGEECDDGNLVNDDACDTHCVVPTCAGGATFEQLQVSLKKRPSRDQAVVKGALAFGPGSPTGYDPSGRGAQLLIEDLGTDGWHVIDLTSRTVPVPSQAAGTCSGAPGWSVSPVVHKFRLKEDRLPPACTPGSASGLTQLVFKDRRPAHHRIEVSAETRNFNLGFPLGPLRVTIVMGASAADGVAGACGSYTFAAGECERSKNGSLKCRRR